MNKIHNYQMKKGNLTINAKIDLRTKTIVKTVVAAAAVVVIIAMAKRLG